MAIIISITVIGAISLIIGIICFFFTIRFIDNSKVIDGVVHDIIKDYINNKSTYYPVVRYFDEFDSKYHNYESNTGYWKSRYRIGDNVQLRYYREEKNRKIRLNTWFDLWGFTFIFTLVGCMFTAFGVFFMMISKLI